MYQELLKQQWKAWWRDQFWQKQLVSGLFKGFMYIGMVVYLLLIGIFSVQLLNAIFPVSDAIHAFNSLLLLYFLLDFTLRLFAQSSPHLDLRHYLHLNISKHALVKYFLVKSFISPFNFFPLLVLLPFWTRAFGETGLAPSLSWLTTVCLLICINHYLQLTVKGFINGNFARLLVILSPVVILLVITGTGKLDIMAASTAFFNLFIAMPALLILPFILLLPVLFAAYASFKKELYLDTQSKSGSNSILQHRLFDDSGTTGALVSNEIRLIWRNKRPATMMVVGFILPALILFSTLAQMETDPAYVQTTKDFIWQFFVVFMLVSYPLANYGQYILSWESYFFDRMNTLGATNFEFFKAKWYLLSLLAGISVLIFIPIIEIINAGVSMPVLPYIAASLLFMSGIGNLFILFFGCMNRKSINPAKQSWMNTEVRLQQFLLVLVIFFLPMLLFAPFALAGNPDMGLALIALTGLTGIILKRRLIEVVVKFYTSNKYEMLEGFRDKN